jgi:hypothetical protein
MNPRFIMVIKLRSGLMRVSIVRNNFMRGTIIGIPIEKVIYHYPEDKPPYTETVKTYEYIVVGGLP